jgi:hypothetical protein
MTLFEPQTGFDSCGQKVGQLSDLHRLADEDPEEPENS